jgi:hypothetical protein
VIPSVRPPKLPRIEDAVKAGSFLCGNADNLIEHQGAREEVSGARRISVSLTGRRAGEGAWSSSIGSRKRLCLHSKQPRHRSRCLSADQSNIFGRFPPWERRPRPATHETSHVGHGCSWHQPALTVVARVALMDAAPPAHHKPSSVGERFLRRNGHAKEYDAYQDLSCWSASAVQGVGGHARAACQRRSDR